MLHLRPCAPTARQERYEKPLRLPTRKTERRKMEEVTLGIGGLILLCITCMGMGACIAHWADMRWPTPCDEDDGEEDGECS